MSQILEQWAIEQASRFRVMGLEAGTDTPVGQMRVVFSDQSALLMSKEQYEAIRAMR